MKNLAFLTFFACVLFACSKKEEASVQPAPAQTQIPPISGESSTVFYLDTFRIYSTDLKGDNRKLVVDENINSRSNYIGSVSTLPGSGKVVYSYSKGYQDERYIKICNTDGSDKKILRTFDKSVDIGFVKGFTDGTIYYSKVLNPSLNTYTTKVFSMQADGTNEKEIKSNSTPAPGGTVGAGRGIYSNSLEESAISAEGKGVLSEDGNFFKMENGVFADFQSFNLFENEDKSNLYKTVLSSDAAKVAFISKTSTDKIYEIKVKDVAANAPKATVAYTLTLPLDVSDGVFGVSIYWVNGSKNLLISYGKYTSPTNASTDFTKCELLDLAKGTTTTWKFTGEMLSTMAN